ncbi:MAG: hypothetical protein KAQ83_02825 [Nanoarchaeota archaeon]|nr:hypothetical protein [Nanoarchaeota archaeon]
MTVQKYNEVRKCRMCSKRFFVDKVQAKQDYNHKFYCNYCYDKYFKNRKDEDYE